MFYLRVQARAIVGPVKEPAIQAVILKAYLAYPRYGCYTLGVRSHLALLSFT